MDNLTHTFIGWTLSRAGLNRFGPWVAPTLMVAANLPDAEIPLLFGDKLNYVIHHRGLSHSLLGLGIESVILTAVVFAITRLWPRRSTYVEETFAANAAKKSAGIPVIFLVCAIGLLSHLALDWLNTYGVRPFLPFSNRWYYGDVLFILDPWTWLILGGSLYLGSSPDRTTRLGWALLCGLASAVIFFAGGAGRIPWAVFAVWFAFVVAIALLKWKPLNFAATSRWPRTVTRIGLAVWIMYLALIFAASRNATLAAMEQHYQSYHTSEQVDKSSALPAPGIPWRFTVVLQTENQIFAYTADVLEGKVRFKERLNRNLNCATPPAIQNTREFKAWEVFARHPCCECDQNTVTLDDARFKVMGTDWFSMKIPVVDKSGARMKHGSRYSPEQTFSIYHFPFSICHFVLPASSHEPDGSMTNGK